LTFAVAMQLSIVQEFAMVIRTETASTSVTGPLALTATGSATALQSTFFTFTFLASFNCSSN